MPFPERFRYGYTPEGGKKADLMFVQHMLAVLTARRHGRHRHAARRAVPRRRRRRDPQRHHRGRPARSRHRPRPEPVLRHRHPRLHPGAARARAPSRRAPRARCCSSTPTASTARAGRRTTCCPSTSRRSSPPTETFADVAGFAARRRPRRAGARTTTTCNIRRYADNAPPPEPHDVRAHLHGGVPAYNQRAWSCSNGPRAGG